MRSQQCDYEICAYLCRSILPQVHRFYRASGGTLQRAQEEALRTAASSKAVRSAARQAVVTGMQAATSE